MHSSTSSFERPVPAGPWLRLLLIALVAFVAAVIGFEWRLVSKGYVQTIDDSEARWQEQRMRANALGERALVLVGASRIQLGVDLPTLQARSGQTPVQLAIDGSSYLPILRGLAADPQFRGSVIVDYYHGVLAAKENPFGVAYAYQKNFEQRGLRPIGSRIEDNLSASLHNSMLVYADGGKPIDALTNRVFASSERPQYLVTLPDRSRMADYRLVRMPAFYHARVTIELGGIASANADAPDAAAILARDVQAVIADRGVFFEDNIAALKDSVARIRSRGGKVYFVAMPTSGMVREIEDRRYPHERFRDRFAALIDAPVVVATDAPGLRDFRCPDGSHLDMRDRVRFTGLLADQLGFRTP